MRLSERIQNGNTSNFLKSLNEGCKEKKEELKEVVKKSPRARKAVKKPRHKAKKR